jgi:zinc transport system substrate-binding protein
MKMPLRSLLFGATLLLGATALRGEEKTVVQSVNYPLHYFATRLATESFELHYLVDPEGDPAFWKPGDDALTAFQKADLILRNGADYEKWMKTVSLPSAKMLDTSKAFSKGYIRTKGKEHRHGNGTVHSHAGTAFTTWIDFSQASQQAEAIATRFKAMQPDSADKIDANLAALKADLDSLHASMKAFGEKWGDQPLVASHPIYQYLARAYDLKIEGIEWEPEMKIEDKDLAELKKILAKHPAKWMIWEGEPTAENIAAVEGLGLKSVVFSPSANVPAEGDWLSVMKANVANLVGMLTAE